MQDRAAAQADLRQAHVNGGTGVVVSGLAWLATGLVWLSAGPVSAFVTLFIAGMAIAPLAGLVERFGFKVPASGPGRRLEWIAIVTVPLILGGFFIAWRWFGISAPQAIPIVAVGVGLRYLAFPLMYGDWRFLALGGVFVALGGWAYAGGAVPAGNVAVILGLIELALGFLLCSTWRKPMTQT